MSVGDLGRRNADSNADHGRVYTCLKAAAIDYRFRPGEQIMIGELAERLRVSSTPVRETLIRLQTEALLETAPRRGFFAKTLNLKEMSDLVQLRFLILKGAIEQATDVIANGAAIALSWIIPDSAGVGDTRSTARTANRTTLDQPDEAVRYIEEASESVAALCHNDAILRALENMNDRTHYVCMIDLERVGRLMEVQLMLDELCLALQRSDVAGVVAVLKNYRDELTERMPALVKEGISRAYTTPSRMLIASQFDAGLPTLRKPVVANRSVFPRR
ncbi:DNA-binding GntR family transcriptional regulator [Bradyrhizobium sp. AZCC 1678]|uniref:GntR family transcriptional regulator n=1 Tax=Bradyrhizobium sp. AZCC 1678 TaxID=3117030 RepID=UPI002FF2C674